MKKLVIISGIIISLNFCVSTAGAQSNYSAVLGKIENALYGFQYTNDDDTTRVNRIEKTVYGQNTSKTNAQKMANLKQDLSADLFGQEIEPKEDTFAEESDSIKEDTIVQAPSTGPGVDYPAINELEMQVFKKEFKKQDLNTRLANLEKKAFGKTFSNEDFSTRVDRLRAELKPKSLIDNAIAQSSNDFYDDEPIELERNYDLAQYESPNKFDYDEYNAQHAPQYYKPEKPAKKVNIASVEKSIFNQAYPHDDINNRLTRLESTMFGTTFTKDSPETRMNRISSAYRAAKSASKYDSNKFSQNAMTAVQIGTLILMVLACIL